MFASFYNFQRNNMTTIVSKWMVKSGFESNVAEIRPFSQLFPPLQFSAPFSHFCVQSSFCTYTIYYCYFPTLLTWFSPFYGLLPPGGSTQKTFFCVKTTELTQPCYSTPFHQLCCLKHTVPKNVFAPDSKNRFAFKLQIFISFEALYNSKSVY